MNTILDALTTTWYENQLRLHEAAAYTRKTPGLMAREVFPMDVAQNPYAKSISFMTLDTIGEAKIIADGALDVPMGDVSSSETAYSVAMLATGFDESNWEIIAAQKLGIDLNARQVNAAYDRMQRLINKLMFMGDAARNIPGLAIDADITKTAATNGGWIAGADAAKVLADLTVQYARHQDACAGMHPVTDILLPIKEYTYLASTRSSAYSDKTLLQYIAESLPFAGGVANIHAVPEMKDFISTNECCVMYNKSDECLQGKIPMEIAFLPPQVLGLGQKVLCVARCGGLHVHYPKSVDIMTGI